MPVNAQEAKGGSAPSKLPPAIKGVVDRLRHADLESLFKVAIDAAMAIRQESLKRGSVDLVLAYDVLSQAIACAGASLRQAQKDTQ